MPRDAMSEFNSRRGRLIGEKRVSFKTSVYALYCGKGKHYHVDNLVAHGDPKFISSPPPSVKGLSNKVIKWLSASLEMKRALGILYKRSW